MNKLQKHAWYCIGVIILATLIYIITGFIYGFGRLLFYQVELGPFIAIGIAIIKFSYDARKHGRRGISKTGIQDERDVDIVANALTYAYATAWISLYLFMAIDLFNYTSTKHYAPDIAFSVMLSVWIFILVYSIVIVLNRSNMSRTRGEITRQKARFENKVFLLRFQHSKMSRQQLAESVGVTHQTIIDLESGEYIPSVILAMQIAGVFGVTVDQVFELDEPEKVDARKLEELYGPSDNSKPNSIPPVHS